MKAFNIYYNGRKINSSPLSKEELTKVFEQRFVYKRNIITNLVDEILSSQIYTRKCIVVSTYKVTICLDLKEDRMHLDFYCQKNF